MVNYERDYWYGQASEQAVKAQLERVFGPLQSGDRYSKFDFWNDVYNIELKTRKCTVDNYPTTMIQCNKFVYAVDRVLVLAFKYTDGLYFIQYDKALFDTFQMRLFSRAGFEWDKKPHSYIPVKLLIRIDEIPEEPAPISPPITCEFSLEMA
jgi:hypothetical protein